MYPVENIPNGDFLYYRAHKSYFKNGVLTHGVFRDQQGGMSTDWNKYSSPEEARGRCSIPADNAIIKLSVAGIRLIEQLSVVHEPLPANRAHTEVFGEKSTEARMKLMRLVEWAITL
jgi:hypothetical protein